MAAVRGALLIAVAMIASVCAAADCEGDERASGSPEHRYYRLSYVTESGGFGEAWLGHRGALNRKEWVDYTLERYGVRVGVVLSIHEFESEEDFAAFSEGTEGMPTVSG